jgi:DNA-binding transcriptional regulator YhcF (GntR family)
MTTTISYVRIPPEAFAIARKELTKAQYDVWTYLCEIDLYGDRLRSMPSPAKIAADLGLHERTVTRATDKLQDVGLFSFEIQEWQGVNHYGVKAEQAKAKLAKKFQDSNIEDSGCCDTFVQNLTSLSNFGQGDPNLDTDVQKMTQRSNFGQDCQNQGSKVALQADSNLSNNSLITINNSLINTGNEIQNESDETFGNFSEEEEDRKFEQEETNVESVATTLKNVQESLNQNELHKEELKKETKPKSENNVVDHSSAAAPKVFSNLREFVIYQAKQDPKINSPEIWADTVLRRNPDDWQAKWDAWEKGRSQTTTYKPEIFVLPDPEAAKKAMEEARKLLPEWMRRNRA